MKKAVHVTIASTLFTLEEDAYQKLQTYLDAIARYFDALPEGREVKRDIEARIAEQLLERLEVAYTSVVTIDHVNHVIEIMGTVEEITDAAEDEREPSHEKASEPDAEPQAPRRLFRDMDRGVIAGVAAGIAAYFDVDPLVVRVICIILFFASGGGMIALYIILAFIIPKAQTPADKVRMRGGPVTLSSFRETVQESAENVRKNGAVFMGEQSVVRRFVDRLFAFFGAIIRGFGRAIVVVGSLFLMIFPSIGILLVLFVAANLAFNAHSPYVNFPAAAVISSGLLYTVVALGVLLVLIPMVFAITIGVSLFVRKWKMRLANGLILVSIWIIAAVTAGTIAVRSVPEIRDRVSNLPEYRVTTQTVVVPGTFTQLALQAGADTVRVIQGPEYRIEVRGTARAQEMLDFSVQGDMLLVAHDAEDRGFCLFCFDHRSSEITITMPTVTGISANGAVDVVTDRLTSSEISITLSDAASAIVEVAATTTSLHLADVSRLTLVGSAKTLSLRGTDAARLIAPGFTAEQATMLISDIFHASTRVTQSVSGTAHDASRFVYEGAAVNTVHTEDIARVEHEDSVR